MNPEFLDNMSWEMAEVYGAISDQIIINLARHFPFYVADTVPTSAFAYQAQMLAQMGQINRETVKIIRQNLLVADEALNRVLEQSIIDAVKSAEPELWEGAKRGIVQPPQRPVVAPNQMRAFQLYYKQSADKLNHVNTVMLESTRQAYAATVADIAARVQATQSALNIATGEVVTGVSSWNTAVKHATDRMKKNGITGFIDHANHHWSAEAYVAMDVRTTVFNTSRAAVWETNENWGNDLYIVSYHNGARPGCYPWQNKVISSINAARDVTDLDGNTVHVYAQSDTSYGEPAGLFGINCGHYPNPFIPGVSVVDGHVQNEEENKRSYEQSQEQRRLERRVREEKRDLEALKAQGADEQMISAQREKVKAASQDIDSFCKETGRQRHRNRESVYTQRDFPAADTYDPAEFTRDQQERIRKWYEEGGEQKAYTFGQMEQNAPPTPAAPVPPVAPKTPAAPVAPASTFKPAKTIEEAEAFARETFVDTNMWGSQGLSLKGISVDSANIVNERLSEFYKTYNVDKFSSLVAPAGNTKLGKAIDGAYAGFNPINKAMILNRNNLKNPKTLIEGIRKERELVADYLAHPEAYERLDKYAKKMLENSRASGRFSVAESLDEVIDHELGHALQRAVKNAGNYASIEANMSRYAPGISGYAQESINEYIAESFAAWRKGGIDVDPELIRAFEGLRR